MKHVKTFIQHINITHHTRKLAWSLTLTLSPCLLYLPGARRVSRRSSWAPWRASLRAPTRPSTPSWATPPRASSTPTAAPTNSSDRSASLNSKPKMSSEGAARDSWAVGDVGGHLGHPHIITSFLPQKPHVAVAPPLGVGVRAPHQCPQRRTSRDVTDHIPKNQCTSSSPAPVVF